MEYNKFELLNNIKSNQSNHFDNNTMSWFSSITDLATQVTEQVNQVTEQVTEQVAQVKESDAFKDLSKQVQDVTKTVSDAIPEKLPTINNETLQKLTLMTPEMIEERQKFREEEERKKRHDSLAAMLPWETHDEERDILVEECKEAILNLSATRESFMGPFQMPPMPKVNDPKRKSSAKDEDGEGEAEETEAAEGQQDAATEEDIVVEEEYEEEEEEKDEPSSESLEKLSKLEPLPPLLADFDLNLYVGLIKRLLKEDDKLSKMQATLSGGGEREKIFWKNYFFHCAFTRYEAGLSIDEIWNEEAQQKAHEKNKQQEAANAAAAAAAAGVATASSVDHDADASGEQTTIVFGDDNEATVETEATEGEDNADAGGASSVATPPGTGTADGEATFPIPTHNALGGEISPTDTVGKSAGTSVGSSEYEMISSGVVDDVVDDDIGGVGDDEGFLDELEAEIARELED